MIKQEFFVCDNATGLYGVAAYYGKVKNISVDVSVPGLKAGKGIVETPWGDLEIPFLCRVYNPLQLQPVRIAVWGTYTIPLGTTEAQLKQTLEGVIHFDDGSSLPFNNTNGLISADDLIVEGFDASTVGDGICYVSYKGCKDAYRYRVYDPDRS